MMTIVTMTMIVMLTISLMGLKMIVSWHPSHYVELRKHIANLALTCKPILIKVVTKVKTLKNSCQRVRGYEQVQVKTVRGTNVALLTDLVFSSFEHALSPLRPPPCHEANHRRTPLISHPHGNRQLLASPSSPTRLPSCAPSDVAKSDNVTPHCP